MTQQSAQQQETLEDRVETLINNLKLNNTALLEALRILADEPNREARLDAIERLRADICPRRPPGC